MREKSLLLISIISMFVVSTALIGSVKAPVVLPNVYVDPPTSTAQPGEIFTIAIKVSGVSPDVGVSGWGFSLQFEFALLYTEEAWITEGDFLSNVGPTSFVKAIVPAESALSAACALLAPVTASGSGTLAYIQFRAEAEGKTLLDLYGTKLRDINVYPIDHTVTDGYFSNIVIGDLVGHGAWPEHHHFVISKDEDGIQTLIGKVTNLGEGNGYIRVNFTVWKMSGQPVHVLGMYMVGAAESKVAPGQTVEVTANLWDSRATAWAPGKYYVDASCLYSADGIHWGSGTKVKSFSFAVVT